MTTYTHGLTLKTLKIITKNDIITMCNLLNNRDEYINLCEFKPEGISEGGIIFNFKNCNNDNWYKSVRLCVNNDNAKGNWDWINDNVINEWTENNDIILDKNKSIKIFLKSFNGAPVFTIDELKIWELCFNQIDIIKVGKYPTEKSLINFNFNIKKINLN